MRVLAAFRSPAHQQLYIEPWPAIRRPVTSMRCRNAMIKRASWSVWLLTYQEANTFVHRQSDVKDVW